MIQPKKILILAFAAACLSGAAQAGDYTSSSNYNGYGATTQNTASAFTLRDANGNLTNVNGQFVSSNYSSNSGVQSASTLGTSGAGTGQSTAIGNSLNVVTVGNNNTVIVDSVQTNNGNQTATTSLTSH